jgi:hypothetical protein
MNGAIVSEEVRKMLIASTHRYRRVREVALKHLDAILTSFAALMCDRQIVFVLLEILTLLRRSCEDAYTDEVSVFQMKNLQGQSISFWRTLVFSRLPLSLGQDGVVLGNHGRLFSSK